MKAIAITLKTQQPILATSFQGDPNSDVSYPYIPGSMIRGAIIGRYMKQQGLQELDLTNNEVRRLFFDANHTRYLNAYLLSQKKERTLPLPLSWFKDKNEEINENSPLTVYNFSFEQDDNMPETPKPVGEYFCRNDGGVIMLYQENRRINIHNLRDRKKGRSTDNQGEIFRYDAIEKDQTFQSVILCEEEDFSKLKDLLTEENLWLGGSRSAGYGHTKINIELPESWNEIGISIEKRENDDFLSLTLLSDTVLRNKGGQAVANPNLIKEAVEEVLNITLPQPDQIFANSTLIGGFNRKWGLPLPQVPALKAGTVIVFKNDNIQINSEQIQYIEAQGIGERREDGFGRVAVNWLYKETLEARLPNSSIQSIHPLKTQESRKIAEQMAQRLLEKKLEQKLKSQVSCSNLQGDISPSQLSRLQSVVRQALPNGDCNLVISFLNNLPSNARNQLERTKVSNESFKHQLEKWLNNPTDWINNIEVIIANIERNFYDEKAREDKLAEKYTLRLIMAIAKKATKEK